jgi:hypothetical protein
MSEWKCSICYELFDVNKLPDGAVIVSEMYRRKIVKIGSQTHILRLKLGGRRSSKNFKPASQPVAVEPQAQEI